MKIIIIIVFVLAFVFYFSLAVIAKKADEGSDKQHQKLLKQQKGGDDREVQSD